MGIFKNLFFKKDENDEEIQPTSSLQNEEELVDNQSSFENEEKLVDNQFSFKDIVFGEITTKILEEGNEFSEHAIEVSWDDNSSRKWATINIDGSITISALINDEEGIIKLIKQIKKYDQKEFIEKIIQLMVEQNYNSLNSELVGLSKEALIEEIINNHYLEVLDYSEYFSDYRFNITKCRYRYLIEKTKSDVYWLYDFGKNEIIDFKIDNYD